MKNLNSILSDSVKRITFILGLSLVCASAFAAEPPALPPKHTTRDIEGWSVRVDDRLLAGESAAIGDNGDPLAVRIMEPRGAETKTVSKDEGHSVPYSGYSLKK